MGGRRVPVFGWVALGIAPLTAVLLANLPCSVRSVSVTGTSSTAPGSSVETVTNSCSSLVEVTNSRVWVILFIPAAFALIAVLGFAVRQRILFLTPTVLLGVFCFLTGFSIGMFFLPTAALLAIACGTWSNRPTGPAG